MKKMINNSEEIFIDIDINYISAALEDDYELDIAADIDIDSEWTKQDIENEFYTFIQNVFGILDIRNFDVVEHHESDTKDSLSYYISFYPVDKDGNELTKYIFHLRISDHMVADIYEKSRPYYKKLSKEFKKDTESDVQRFRFQNITINESTKLKDTDDALDFIEFMCDKIMLGQHDTSRMLKQFTR